MQNPTDKGYFVELNDFSLLLARSATLRSPVAIEDLREIPLDNKSAVAEAVQAVFPDAGGTVNVLGSLRPKQRWFHLSTNEQAKKYSLLAMLPAVFNEPELANLPPCEFTAVYTQTGLPLSGQGSPWLLASASQESYTQAVSLLQEFKLAPARVSPATLGAAGGILSALKLNAAAAPVLLLEFGEISAHLFLIGRNGIEGVRSTAVTMDKIAEAVQVELGLKFKGSAGKLFFNEFYDFSEAGPKIAGRVAQELAADIGALGGSPVSFACGGLSSKQNWFVSSLATALNLAPFAPDFTAWNAQAGLTFADSAIESALTPAWLGFLNFIGGYQVSAPEKSVWQPDWTRKAPVSTAAPEPAPEIAPPPAPAAEPAPVPVPVAAPAPAPEPAPMPVPVAIPVPPAPPKPIVPAAAPAAPKPSPAVPAKPFVPTPATVILGKPVTAKPFVPTPPPSAAKPAAPGTTPAPAPFKPTPQPAAAAPAPFKPTPPPAAPAAPFKPTPPPAAAAPAPFKPTPPPATPAAPFKPTPPAAPFKPAAPAAVAPAPFKPAPTQAASPAPATPPAPFKPAVPATPPPAKPAVPAIPVPQSRPVVAPPPAAKPPVPPAPPKPAPAKPPAPAVPPAKPAAPAPAPAAKPAAMPAKPAMPPPPPAKPAVATAPIAPKPVTPSPAAPATAQPGFLKSPAGYMTIAATVLVLGAAGYFFFSGGGGEKAPVTPPSAQTDEAKTELARKALEANAQAQAAAQKEKQEAAALKKAQEDAAAQVAAAQAAAKKADEERAAAQAAARLANARGSINLVTEPAGATVTVDDLPPRQSPALIGDLKLGHHTVAIKLKGYDDTSLDFEVKENATTDPGLIKLTKPTGTIAITTEPDGVGYILSTAAEHEQAAPSAAASTVVDESWSDADRTKQNPPSSLAWYTSGNSANVTVAKGSLTMSTDGSSRHMVAYFPRQTLKSGDTLTLTYQVSLGGPLQQIGNASSTSLKVGLFDSHGDYVYNADNQQSSNPVSYVGYAVGADFNAPGDASGSPLNIRKRYSSSAGNLISSNSGIFFTLKEKEPVKQAWQADTTYIGTIKILALDGNQVKITASYTGGGLDNYTVTAFDKQPASSEHPPVTTFDNMAFALPASGGQTAAQTLTLYNVRLVYSPSEGAGKRGTTPATVDDLIPGDYYVTITRDGFPNHTEKITLKRGETARVAWKFSNGGVIINSTPSGATVTRNGLRIGVTPLALENVAPGDVSYTLSLAGYDDASVSGTVGTGAVLTLTGSLDSVDRLVKASDLDVRPVPVKQVDPTVPPEVGSRGGSAEIAVTIDRQGNPKDLAIVRSTNQAFARLCLEAVAQWRFKPGMVDGKAVNVRIEVPFSVSAGGN